MPRSFDAEALIAQMTIEEKAGQLTLLADAMRPFAPGVNPDSFTWGPEKLRELIRAGRVGGLFNGVGAAKGREVQQLAVEESRLGIPLLFGADVIHGMRTVFPIPLGEAASFEPALAERTARAIAVEATREGIHWTFAPMVDVARDQRWGRVAEGSGEDTYLGSQFAAARVRGFQGRGLRAADALLATPKHFAAYGAVCAGLEYNHVDLAPQTLREVHLPPFKAALDAGALAIMTSFNDINGVPATANHELLTQILREQWGYAGFVVSDYTSDFELIAHGYASDEREAARRSLGAGLDVSMQSGLLLRHLPAMVADGELPLEVVDAAVRRVLSVKAALGLFEDPYRSLDPAGDAARPYESAHDALAREAGRRSIVLLKNHGALPLRSSGQRMALIGPFASDRAQLAGCWDLFGDAQRGVSLEDGMRAALRDPSALTVTAGCAIGGPIAGGIEAAVAAARAADVIVLALGEPADFTGEAHSRTQIGLPAAQVALTHALVELGKPVVIVLRNGRALALEAPLLRADAILVGWFLGTQTGYALADVLFGAFNPSGRLPVSFPIASGQVPYYYNHPRTGRPYVDGGPVAFTNRWIDVPNEARFPFGHGLGYARVGYGRPQLSGPTLAWDGEIGVSVEVTNLGERPCEEVVQLYVHDRIASRVRPVRELKGFQKIALVPGQTRTVTFSIRREMLAFVGLENLWVCEPGEFDVWIAPSSAAGEPVRFALLPAGSPGTGMN